MEYDICVIGAGPGGLAAAFRACDLGRRVALIERKLVGGAELAQGVLWSKTLWELSRDYRRAVRTDRGYKCEGMTVSYDEVSGRVQDTLSEKRMQYERQLALLNEPAPGRGTVTLLRGTAKFLDPHTVELDGPHGVSSIAAAHFILATGSRPTAPPNAVPDGERIFTSDTLPSLDRFPKSMVVLGAGVVGCELATIFANFGQTNVFLIDRAPRILPSEDADLSDLYQANLLARGVTVHHSANVTTFERRGDSVHYQLLLPDGTFLDNEVEYGLISTGRAPNTDGLGLEAAGVKISDRGYLACTGTETSVPHIHAVGDITFDIALASVAEIEGRRAAEICAGIEHSVLGYENLSAIMFLDPEVASVGLNESKAREKKLPYRVATYPLSLVNRAIAMQAPEGFIKLLVTDDDEMYLLGMRVLGAHASSTVTPVSILMKCTLPVRVLTEIFMGHPAISEGLQECARLFFGNSFHKPEAFPDGVRAERVAYDAEGNAECFPLFGAPHPNSAAVPAEI